MPYILSNLQRATNLHKIITEIAEKMKLKQVTAGKNACQNVAAEEDCNNCYESGQEYLGCFKNHISNAGNYILEIAEALERADQAAVSSVK